jgi:NADP-dependent 3-hydroxy acid dehydrogenase YdfG
LHSKLGSFQFLKKNLFFTKKWLGLPHETGEVPKKCIVITGASSGIGQATARLLSEKGYPVALLARRKERLAAMNIPNSLTLGVDVTNLASFKDAITNIEDQLGEIDCIINNAGVMLLGMTHEQDPAEWQKMVDVNITGLMNGIHLVLPKMIKRQCGTIINISSIAGIKGFPAHAAYCGTKFAVHGISETLREEVAKHQVRVIVIAPGAVETELLGHTTSVEIKQNYEKWKKQVGGVLTAENVAETIVFAYQQPQQVCLREIVLSPTKQEP